jgi:putative membrane protein
MNATKSFFDLAHIGAALFYSALGLVILVISFEVFDKVTPYKLWEEIIQKQNRALATVVGSICVAMSIIIAAAIVG